jgi:hypothetical protein
MKQKLAPLGHRAVARGQNGSARRPHVRSNTSGSTSMVMSQRTPSHCPTIFTSIEIIVYCVAGFAWFNCSVSCHPTKYGSRP